MKKSIESTWKDGFLKKEMLVAPKINDLYSRKSNDIIERFQKRFRINVIILAGASLFVLVFYFFEGLPFVGLSLSVLFILLMIAGRKQLAALKKIDRNKNSYQYLRAFDTCLKNIISDSARIGRVLYPGMFLFITTDFFFVLPNTSEKLVNIMNDPDTYLYQGIPIFWAVGVAIIVVLLSYFGDRIYVWDFKLVYGRLMKRIDRTLKDMEELIE